MDLLTELLKGNPLAIRVLYDRYATKVYNTAISYAQNAEDAEEITQDVFVQVIQSISNFREDASLSTWIYRITVNKSLDFLRKKKSQKRTALIIPLIPAKEEDKKLEIPDFVHPGILLENQEHAKILFKAIDSLADKQKTAFILTYIEDLPQQETAVIMETSVKAVESLLQRAKKNLRKKLEKYYPNRRKK